jgi:hypothetical protein
MAAAARQVDLANLLSQLGSPVTLPEAFNANHILSDENIADNRETLVCDVCADFDLILLNTGAHMHLCLVSEVSSALDLNFVVQEQ